MRLHPALLAVLVAPVAASAGESFLDSLPALRDYEVHRITSHDTTGGNRDWRPLEPGDSLVLADIQGPGCIVHFRDNVTSREPHHLQTHILRMYWDGEATPSVEAPIGDFFATGFGFTEKFSSALMSVDARRGELTDPAAYGAARNCYIPMPYARSARITLTNEGQMTSRHWYEVNYRSYRQPPEGVGYFHAQYRQGTPPAAGPYLILEAQGRGHLLGCVLSVKNNDGGWWGEGDEIVYIDGQHAMQGTGSEDYFCESYGLRPGCFPYYGVTLCTGPYTTAYRWHVPDPVPFRESLRFLIEHGRGNPPFESGNYYYSVAYWYQTEPHAPFPPLPPVAERLTWAAKPRFIRDWWVIGPFDNRAGEGFERVYPPEQETDLARTYPGEGGQVGWTRATADQDGRLDFTKLFAPNEEVAVYALCCVNSPRTERALLLTGSDDTITAWLNGEKVLAKNERRDASPDQDMAEVILEKGRNTLLIKVCQEHGFWDLYCRFTDPSRQDLEGLSYTLEQGTGP